MNTLDYNNQRPWSDKFLLQDKKILASVFNCNISLIDITTPEVDMKMAADLVIKSDDKDENGVYVAVRTRTDKYADMYADEFTIRAKYSNGIKTEHEKIMEGFGDIMLYGFVKNDIITRWKLLDLDVYRKENEKDHIIKEHKINRDGRNSFYAYNIFSFKSTKTCYPDILIAWSENYFNPVQINKLKQKFKTQENYYGN